MNILKNGVKILTKFTKFHPVSLVIPVFAKSVGSRGCVRARVVPLLTGTTIDEVWNCKHEYGEGREERRCRQYTWFVGIAAKMTDSQYHYHVTDVVDVSYKSRQRTRQTEPALDLRNHGRVVSETYT